MQDADYQRFAAALVDADCAIPRNLFCTQGADLADRFAIYRNNVHASLVDALADRYPIVHALVGDEFFQAMARCFVQEHKPQTPLLTAYGNQLPDFIADFPGASGLPWLADVARLEDAWQAVWCAAEAPVLALRQLTGFAPDSIATATLRAHPATRLLSSNWPVASIWQKHQHPQPDLSDLHWQAESVLVTRPDAEIQLLQLPDEVARFATALLQGCSIEAASQQVSHNSFDPGAALTQLIGAGAFSEITPC